MPTNLKLHHLMFIFMAAILVLTPCTHASISSRVVTPTGLGLRNAAGFLSEGSDARSVATNADTKIVFVSGRDGNAEIYVMNADGSGQTRLTYTPEDETFPAGSPDGLSIAFLRRYTPSGSYSVHVMNRDGTDVRVVPGAFADDPGSISWSPDSTRIAFANSGKINTIKVDGSGATVLSPNGSGDFAPSWSPDGSWIAFGRRSLSVFGGGIFKMRTDGSETTPVVPGRFLGSPSWSPDGARIVFSYGIEGGTLDDGQAIAFIENGLVVDVINDPNVLPDGAKYSPDGQKLIYYQTSREPNFPPYQIVSTTQAITVLSSDNFQPDWLRPPVSATISGRTTTPGGLGLRNATVILSDQSGARRVTTTSSFGFYDFTGIQTGRAYTVSVISKRYRFQARTFTMSENISGFDLIGLE